MKPNSYSLQVYLKFKCLNIHDEKPISEYIFSDVRSSHQEKLILKLAPGIDG